MQHINNIYPNTSRIRNTDDIFDKMEVTYFNQVYLLSI